MPDFPLKPLRGKKPARQPAVGSLWQRSVQERVNNNKGEVGEAFLKVMWSVLGRGGEWRRDGRSLERVAVETVSSVGQCEVRGVILGGDCS